MRFILMAQPRTGTTVLRNLLNQNRLVYVYNEAFYPALFKWGWYTYLQERIEEDPRAILPTQWANYVTPFFNSLFEAKENNRKAVVGIDVKIPQAELIRAVPKAVRDSGAGILHLRRRNTLASIVSYRIMARRVSEGGRAHGTKPAKSEPLPLNVEWLKFRIPEFENQDEMVKWIYRDQPYLELFYEDAISPTGWDATCDLLSNFFGMRFKIPFTPRLQKQNSPNLADLIQNADEVRRHFPQYFDAGSNAAGGAG